MPSPTRTPKKAVPGKGTTKTPFADFLLRLAEEPAFMKAYLKDPAAALKASKLTPAQKSAMRARDSVRIAKLVNAEAPKKLKGQDVARSIIKSPIVIIFS